MIKYLTRNPWQSVGCKGGEKGIKKWSAPFGKPPPSPPDKIPIYPLGSVLPFIVSIKRHLKLVPSKEGCRGVLAGACRG